jgi:hypothetical protein
MNVAIQEIEKQRGYPGAGTMNSGALMDAVTNTITQPIRPGKSAQSVGHLAKAAVAEAKANGVDVPKNAQGVAASAIARGAEPALVFAAQIETPPVDEVPASDPTAPVGDTDDAPAATPEAVAEAEDGYATAAVVLTSPADSGAETALALLKADA